MPLLNLSISQLLWVFVAANLLKKLKPNVLFLRWLSSRGLTCYRVPDNNELRRLQYIDTGDSKKNQSKSAKASRTKTNGGATAQTTSTGEFKIKSSDLIKLNLKKVDIDSRVLSSAPYGGELEWVVDFAFMSLISFILIEVLFYFSPRTNEYNFSLVWVLLVIVQCLLILLRLTSIYFRNEVSIGERSICIVSGCIFLLVAMLILTIDESRLELGINNALQSWTNGATKLPSNDALLDLDEIDTPPPLPSVTTTRPTHTIITKLLIALVCSIVSVIFTFPGFRFGQLHESFLANPEVSILDRIIYNFNYMSPVMIICLWIPTISRDPLKKQDLIEIDDKRFEMIRACILIVANLIRFALSRKYTEVFLASGSDRINRIRFRGGMTTNKDVQLSIAGMNNYTNVVSMQYILPTLICLFTSIMYSALIGISSPSSRGSPPAVISIVDEDDAEKFTNIRHLFGNQTFVLAAEQIVAESRRLLSSDIPKNVFNFATWWFHFSWFCTSTAGMVYHKYFTY